MIYHLVFVLISVSILTFHYLPQHFEASFQSEGKMSKMALWVIFLQYISYNSLYYMKHYCHYTALKTICFSVDSLLRKCSKEPISRALKNHYLTLRFFFFISSFRVSYSLWITLWSALFHNVVGSLLTLCRQRKWVVVCCFKFY